MENKPGNPDAAYWSQPEEKVLATLQTTKDGLTTAEAARRLARYGPNDLNLKRRTGPVEIFLSQFKSPIVIILLVATLISAFLQDWTDAIIILVIVLFSAVLSFFQEYSANNAAEKLRSQVQVRANVLRNGKAIQIPAREVVPGDIVQLSAGSLVPADGVVLEANACFTNQAVLTGETYPVEKRPGPLAPEASLAERSNCLFMGTSLSSGTARMVVSQTGENTAFGQIAERLTLRPEETDFERGIRHFGYLLSEVTLIMVITVFAFNVILKKDPLDSLLFSIALAVGLTPQLLPAIININLSRGSQRMAARGVIVRKLNAIENFGSMDVLCTDKTGTITQGVVRLDQACGTDGKPSDAVKRLAYINAKLQNGMANALDDAITTAASYDLSSLKKSGEIPYDFHRKRLSIAVQEAGQSRLIAKGALENILEICSQVAEGEGEAPLDRAHLDAIDKLFKDWSGQGFRVLGVADRQLGETDKLDPSAEHDMTLRGFLLFFDPPKEGVNKTLEALNALGVQVKIITGDNRLAAAHTAQAIGLPAPTILTGSQISQLRDEALWAQAEKTDLFAEVDPNEKERIILALRKMGHVVGYMGDGINDAPSLHAADVGISVDSAVDVAKEAADFVLLHQDLDVLHQGILEGRTTFSNTLKYVFMATSANFGNMFSVAGASLFLSFLPMLPKQILLINLLTDLPEMTISGDNVDPDQLQQPRRWDIAFIRRFMFVFGILSSVFDYATFGVLFLLGRGLGTSSAAFQQLFHTGWFVESVVSATLVVYIIRTRLSIFRSRPSRVMMTVTVLVVLFTVALPFTPLAGLFEFTPLSPLFLLAVAGIVILYMASALVARRLFYRWHGFPGQNKIRMQKQVMLLRSR
ncbi:MAG TPA: magnesium-translocating P-type ATPase [Anaerolineaceae bacterium]